MKIEDQVVSLKLAQKLKELGVKQQSIFYWVDLNFSGARGPFDPYPMHYGDLGKPWDKHSLYENYWIASAFTVAELGEMLPVFLEKEGYKYGINQWSAWIGEKWRISYDFYDNRPGLENQIKYFFGNDGDFAADTEADARAKMLIYLNVHALDLIRSILV